MKISLPKLKAMILFFATHTDKSLLGKVKLMKLFYFTDFSHVKNYGVPITWDTYVNLEHGPIPSGIKNLVDTVAEDIDNSILSDTIRIEKLEDSLLYRIIPLRKFTEQDKKYFTDGEFTIIKAVCGRFADKNTREIELASHKESAWKNTSLLEEISYLLAAEDADCQVPKEEIELSLNILD